MLIAAKTNVMYRKWAAASPKAAVLFVHGLGGHSGRWECLADYLAQKDITCYAIELKGFGETKGLKGHIDSFGIYFDDINALRAMIKRDHPGGKVFLLGESLGGVLAFLMTAADSGAFDGLICVSPAFKSRLKFSFFKYAQICFASLFNPRRQFAVPFNPRMCTRDADYQKVMAEDAREHQVATARLLVNILAAQIRARFLQGRHTIPVLFLLAGDDVMVDSTVSLKIYQTLKVKDKAVIQYPEMSHALSIDLGREKVFADIAAWLQKRAV